MLSALQFDIEKLEKQLDKLDDFDKSSPNGDARKLSSLARDNLDGSPERLSNNEEFQNRFAKTRPEMLTELRAKLAEYGNASYLLKWIQLQADKRTQTRCF